MEHCFLSVIIPVYNASGYLSRTLDSLLEQDMDDYEILCINDGSTDDSAAILEKYQKNHLKVAVVHQENAGVAAARNTGLRYARGKYIWFVDADDLVAPNCLGKLKALAETHHCQRLTFGGYSFVGDLTEQQREHADMLPCNVPWQDSVVWRSWLRLDFLKDHNLIFRYPDITHGEDGLYMFEVSRMRPTTVDIPDILYFYRIHPGSAETEKNLLSRRKRLRSHLRVVEVLKGYYLAEGGENAATRLMSFLWLTLYEIACMPKPDAHTALERLRELELYPFRIPEECTVRKTYLVDDSTRLGKFLEFLCSNLHRPWAYSVLRLLHQAKNMIRRG